MKGWGITLIILGIGSFILPAMNMQFALISVFGEGNEAGVGVGVGFIAIGAMMAFVGSRQ